MIGQYVDKRIIHKVYEWVKNNVTNLGEVKSCLSKSVENEVFSKAEDILIGDSIPTTKTSAITLHQQFPCKRRPSFSATRLMIGVNNLPSDSAFTGQQITHPPRALATTTVNKMQ